MVHGVLSHCIYHPRGLRDFGPSSRIWGIDGEMEFYFIIATLEVN